MSSITGLRTDKRVSYHLAVSCLGPFTVLEGKTRNLSVHGVCITIGQRPEVDKGLLLIFKVPTRNRPFAVCARVRWARPGEGGGYRCGLEHIWMSEDDRRDLADFLSVLKGDNEQEGPTVH